MTIEQFAETTRRVIVRDGFAEFLPTACYPSRRHVKTLEGLPPDIDVEPAVLDWAAETASEGEEFLVAFAVDREHFRIVHSTGETRVSKTYPVES